MTLGGHPHDVDAVSVLHVIAGLDPASGGPPVAAVTTVKALRRQGCAAVMAFPVEAGREYASAELIATLRANGSGVHIFGEPRILGAYGPRWGISPALAAWLLRRARRFDVVHAHAAWTFSTVAALVCAKLFRRVAILTPHESLTDFDQEKSGPLHRAVKRLLRWIFLRAFDAVVVASTLERDDMSAGRAPVFVVPHAVAEIEPTPRSGPPIRDLRVGYLGRLDPKKNVEVLIDAMALLPDSVTLHIAGDGPTEYREVLAERAASRGVARRVTWLGFVDDRAKARFLASVDVVAMPSAFECFGVAAAEALCAGVPVLVSPNVGIAGVVEQYGCGGVVAATGGDFARALENLMNDREGLRRQAEGAGSAAAAEFSLDRHGQRLIAVYRTVVRAHGSRASHEK